MEQAFLLNSADVHYLVNIYKILINVLFFFMVFLGQTQYL